MQKLVVRACIQYLHYVPIGMTSPTAGLGSIVLSVASFSTLIFIYVFRESVADLDQVLASAFSSAINSEGIYVSNPYDVGLISFINTYPLIYILFPLSVILLCYGILFFVVGSRDKSVYLYFPLSFCFYVTTVQTVVIVLKVLLRRPRPRNTHEFGILLETCKYEFKAIFTPHLGRSQCSHSLSSTPSGHTAAAAYCILPSVAYIIQLFELIRAYWAPKLLGLTILSIIMGLLLTVVAVWGISGIILMIIARMSAGAHFLSDTLTAVLIAAAFLSIVVITRPDIHAVQMYEHKDDKASNDQERITKRDDIPLQ
ncbi:Hypothetical protein GLP15_4535 [Giardia lamblia P15]|uniref:Phosphatidic acid phosphatase type 2/haloperoxidase domain-containing protein n=1 Tax=Giardia intestinalis (strain P15) TaxID=658858 RepID=E1F3E3_GIAIA|nr:Hypothetical protein GLP15_4535 [Giardia lamblia P15]